MSSQTSGPLARGGEGQRCAAAGLAVSATVAPMLPARMRRRVHTSVRQRIGAELDVHGAWAGAFAGFHQPWRAVAIRAPQAAALPAGVWIIDARVHAFGEEADGVGEAHRDELAVLQRNK